MVKSGNVTFCTHWSCQIGRIDNLPLINNGTYIGLFNKWCANSIQQIRSGDTNLPIMVRPKLNKNLYHERTLVEIIVINHVVVTPLLVWLENDFSRQWRERWLRGSRWKSFFGCIWTLRELVCDFKSKRKG